MNLMLSFRLRIRCAAAALIDEKETVKKDDVDWRSRFELQLEDLQLNSSGRAFRNRCLKFGISRFGAGKREFLKSCFSWIFPERNFDFL